MAQTDDLLGLLHVDDPVAALGRLLHVQRVGGLGGDRVVNRLSGDRGVVQSRLSCRFHRRERHVLLLLLLLLLDEGLLLVGLEGRTLLLLEGLRRRSLLRGVADRLRSGHLADCRRLRKLFDRIKY
uniref:(northern house mosquito) hypothetical protein n=1 Tax=Culex pipiens TaxID=7175 RepID=A0A8D8JE15_CULPI